MYNLLIFVLFTLLLNLKAIEGEKSSLGTRCKREEHCVLTPQQGEGPYYIPEQSIRSDIRENKEGLRFNLQIIVNDVNTCQPLPNVSVDIWHCDALGYYSGYLANYPVRYALRSNPVNPNHVNPSDNSTFLRGVQITDSNGSVNFVTIFPGWYTTRAVHIHVEGHISGQTVYTGQLYFPENLTSKVEKIKPYSMHKSRRYKNEEDSIFSDRDKGSPLLHPKPINGDSLESGLNAQIILAIDSKHNQNNSLN